MNEEGKTLRLREKDGETLESLPRVKVLFADRILLETQSGQVVVLKDRDGPTGVCAHERTLFFGGKVSGGQGYTTWPNGIEEDDPPSIEGISKGDYIGCTVCIDCHTAIGLPSAEDILAAQPKPDDATGTATPTPDLTP